MWFKKEKENILYLAICNWCDEKKYCAKTYITPPDKNISSAYHKWNCCADCLDALKRKRHKEEIDTIIKLKKIREKQIKKWLKERKELLK